jgi:hypothetical protein
VWDGQADVTEYGFITGPRVGVAQVFDADVQRPIPLLPEGPIGRFFVGHAVYLACLVFQFQVRRFELHKVLLDGYEGFNGHRFERAWVSRLNIGL